MNNRVFIATPISGFYGTDEYQRFRMFVLRVVSILRDEGYIVCTELERIVDSSDYSSPQKSLEDDFYSILSSGVFLLIHPKPMQTSSLIELGFACANNKKIVIVGNMDSLPYLAKNLPETSIRSVRIDFVDYSYKQIKSICEAIDEIVKVLN